MLQNLKFEKIAIIYNSSQTRLLTLFAIELLLLLELMDFAPWVGLVHRVLLFVVTVQYAKELDTSNKLQYALESLEDSKRRG